MPRILAFACLLLSIALQSAGESLPFERLDDIRGPFEGTGIRGDALYVRELGRIGNLPLQAYWSSARLNSSTPNSKAVRLFSDWESGGDKYVLRQGGK